MQDYMNLEGKVKKSKLRFGTKVLIGTGAAAFGAYSLGKAIKKVIYPPTLKKYTAIAVAGLMIYSVTHFKTVTSGAIDLFQKHVKPAITEYVKEGKTKVEQDVIDKVNKLLSINQELEKKYSTAIDAAKKEHETAERIKQENEKLKTESAKAKIISDNAIKQKYELEQRVKSAEKNVEQKINVQLSQLHQELAKKQEGVDKLYKEVSEIKKQKEKPVTYAKKPEQKKSSGSGNLLGKRILNAFAAPIKGSFKMMELSAKQIEAVANKYETSQRGAYNGAGN
jgi:hypothetical protein